MSQTLLLHGQICVLPGRRKALRPVTGGGGTTEVNVAVVRRGLRQWKRILGTFLRRILCTEM